MLVIDIGNTNLVFGYWENATWKAIWREETSLKRPVSDFNRTFRIQLLEHDIPIDSIAQVVLGSVVPPLTTKIEEMIIQTLNVNPIVLQPKLYKNLSVEIENTEEIGADLVANAVAAFQRYQQSCLIVDFGTALTFTAISGQGKILGVAIAPGLKTAMRALSGNTAQLPEVPLTVPSSPIGKNTVHAMQAGILTGYHGLVEHMIAQITSEMKEENVKIIATGGLSSILPKLHELYTEVDPLLTLEGLRHIGQEN